MRYWTHKIQHSVLNGSREKVDLFDCVQHSIIDVLNPLKKKSFKTANYQGNMMQPYLWVLIYIEVKSWENS